MEINSYKLMLVRDSGVVMPESPAINPQAVIDILKVYFEGADREIFVVLAVNSKKKVIGINTAHIGTLDRTQIHPREIFKFAFLANAAEIIVAHNHPSGDLSPSDADVSVTKQLIEAGNLLQLPLLDHIIVTEDRHYSFKEKQSWLWNESKID